ncbi:MAG: ABC transporter permease [Candidatus Nanosynbacter sp.]|nr:ABC transporter permease [Candidatus Nanosynbacter sp.]
MLFLKMLRDVRKNFSQFLMIFLMVLLGTAACSGIDGYIQGMQSAVDRFYEDGRLQDLNIRGALSEEDLKKVSEFDGVQKAEGKLVAKGQVLNILKAKNEPSEQNQTTTNTETKNSNQETETQKINEQNKEYEDYKLELNLLRSNEIARFTVEQGEGFAASSDKIWIDAYFAKKNQLKVNDEIVFKYLGKTFKKSIAGIVYIPDHAYVSKSSSEILPDNLKYAYAFMDYQKLISEINHPELSNTKTVYSQIMVKVKDTKRTDNVKSEIQDYFKKRAVVTKMREEPTVKVLQGEIDENSSIIGIFTGFFILISILSVATTMTRLISRDRTKIGTLKALGFSNAKIFWHYISYGVYLSILGGLAGIIVGPLMISKFFMSITMRFFEVPNCNPVLTITSIIVYICLTISIAITCYLATRHIIKQNTTEILRPEQPKINSRKMRFTTSGNFAKLSFTSRWNLRDMLRNRGRMITTVVGISGAIALVVMAFGVYTSMNNFIETEINMINNFENTAMIDADKTEAADMKKIADTFTNNSEQKYIELVDKNNQSFLTTNLFIDNSGGAIKFLNEQRETTELDNTGVNISRKIATEHGLRIGDTIRWRNVGDAKIYEAKITKLIVKQQTQNLTITKDFYESMGEKYTPTTFYLSDNDLAKKEELTKYLNIQSKAVMTDNLKQMLKTILNTLAVLLSLAVFLGIVVFYNMGILSFCEQEIQFATMKVIGFSSAKLLKIFTWQNIFITILSGLIGLPLGLILTNYIYQVSVDDAYDIQTFIPWTVLALSMLGALIFSIVLSRFLAIKIHRIDMVKALKTGE